MNMKRREKSVNRDYKKKYSAKITLRKDTLFSHHNDLGSNLKPILKRTKTNFHSPQAGNFRRKEVDKTMHKAVTFKATKTVFLIGRSKKKRRKSRKPSRV